MYGLFYLFLMTESAQLSFIALSSLWKAMNFYCHRWQYTFSSRTYYTETLSIQTNAGSVSAHFWTCISIFSLFHINFIIHES